MLRIVLLALYLSYLLSSGSFATKNANVPTSPTPATLSPTTTTDQGSGADPWGLQSPTAPPVTADQGSGWDPNG